MRTFLLFFVLVACKPLFSQTSRYNTALQFKREKANPEELLQILVKGNLSALQKFEAPGQYIWHYQSGDIASISCNLSILSKLTNEGIIQYAEYIPAHKQALNDTMLRRNRIIAVHAGESPLSQAYDGTGILFGMIDTGIDFNHKDFKDSLGNSRILYLWDQGTASNSVAPQPYNYGREWTNTEINTNLCTHNDLPFYGHGTHVAGIGAGNGRASGHFKGAAPKTEIIAVALNFYSNGPVISDGVKYIFSKAQALNKPCVINISVGDYYGSHDGTDLETKIIENEILANTGRAVIGAAGNAGSVRFHTKTQVQTGDTLFTWLQENGAVIDHSFFADTLQAKNLKISVGANRANFSDLGRVNFQTYNATLNTITNDTIKNNGNRIGIVKMSGAVNSSGVYEMAIEILADTNNLFWRIESTGQGLHHAWNFSFVGSNLPSITQYPKMIHYVAPDSLYSMVSGFQNSDQVITVANYDNMQRYYDVRDTLHDTGEAAGHISGGSSLGPTRDGRQKPDIAAGGQFIFSAAVLSMLPNIISSSPQDVATDSLHVFGGGTSAAAPIVTGIAALYFQKNPTATHLQLKHAMLTCAYQDNFTGTILPNFQWGYGKIDGKNTLLCEENLMSIAKNKLSASVIYPNPFHHQVTIKFPQTGKKNIQVLNLQAQVIYETNTDALQLTLGSAQLGGATGLLLLKIKSDQSQETIKLVRETCE